MTTEKKEVKDTVPKDESKDGKQPWVTPQAKEYDPSKLTESGSGAPSGADAGFYS